jgi:BirA family transcriptional regulator, biotin operon repressor / biotin---[acetyl-CoA-carboxylase] ligase
LTSGRSTDALPRELADAIAAAASRLGPFARRVHYFATTGSTNDVASALASEGEAEGSVVVADAQTAGRGRRGRTWFSPPGAGLYVSVILAPARAEDAARARMLTTLAAGVAMADGIAHATGLRADLKWPNDVYVARRKLAGILAEGIGESVVLGYGVNIAPAAYPPELSARVTSLESELGRPVDRPTVFVETLAALAARYADLLAGRFDAILDAWRAQAPGSQGAHVSWTTPAGVQTGTTAGIDDHGALLVRVGERTERIVAGELTWL